MVGFVFGVGGDSRFVTDVYNTVGADWSHDHGCAVSPAIAQLHYRWQSLMWLVGVAQDAEVQWSWHGGNEGRRKAKNKIIN